MAMPPRDVRPLKAWDHPSIFKIYDSAASDVNNPQVAFFANGRQQAEVYVDVELVDDVGFPPNPAVSQAEVENMVRLITYGQIGDQYVIGHDNQPGNGSWKSSYVSNGYNWERSFLKKVYPELDELPQRSTDQKAPATPPDHFTVTATATASGGHAIATATASASITEATCTRVIPHGTQNNWFTLVFLVSSPVVGNLRVAARLKFGTKVFHTGETTLSDPNGRGRADNGEGFNSSVTLTSVAPYTPSPASNEFGIKDPRNPSRLDRLSSEENAPTYFYEHAIELNFKNTKVKPLKLDEDQSRMLWDHDTGRSIDGRFWSIVFCIVPGGNNYVWATLGPDGEKCYFLRDFYTGANRGFVSNLVTSFRQGYVSEPSSYRLAIGLLNGSTDWRIQNSTGQQSPSQKRIPLRLIDEFGTTHSLSLSIDNLNYCTLGQGFQEADPPDPRLSYMADPTVKIIEDRLFANGKHQAKVEVGFRILDGANGFGGVERNPTTEELKSLRLIDYLYGTDIPLTDENYDPPSPNHSWTTSRKYNGFESHPESIIQPPTDGSWHYDYFYISGPGSTTGNQINLGFSITLSDGFTYRTNGKIYWADGTLFRNEPYIDTKIGKRVFSTPPIIWTATDFQLTPNPNLDDLWKGDLEIEVSIRTNLGKPLGIHSGSCTPDGVIHWSTPATSDTRPCAIGYAAPGSTTVQHNELIRKTVEARGQTPPPESLSYARPQRLVILLSGFDSLTRRDFAEIPPQDVVALSLVDMYGTDQQRKLRFEAGKRSSLIFE